MLRCMLDSADPIVAETGSAVSTYEFKMKINAKQRVYVRVGQI